jgi:hypothetical protein
VETANVSTDCLPKLKPPEPADSFKNRGALHLIRDGWEAGRRAIAMPFPVIDPYKKLDLWIR